METNQGACNYKFLITSNKLQLMILIYEFFNLVILMQDHSKIKKYNLMQEMTCGGLQIIIKTQSNSHLHTLLDCTRVP